MTAYSRGMSTAESAPSAPSPGDCPTAVIPAGASLPVRRSILRPARPAPQDDGAPFEDWRGQAVTEELAAVPAPRRPPRQARRRSAVRRHLRSAMIGTLLAIVAITGLSSYAASGITDARSTALCEAHISCK